MRLPWLITVCALLALVTLWLWPDAAGRAAPEAPLAGDSAGAQSGAPLTAAGSTAGSAPERATVEASTPDRRPLAEQQAQGAADRRRLRVRFLDGETELPLVGFTLDLVVRFSRSRERIQGVTDEAGELEVRVRPGELLALQQPVPGDAEHVARVISPEVFDVPAGDDTFVVILHGHHPAQVLEVAVARQDGSPAAEAWVLFDCKSEELRFVDTRARTDEQGRAWLGVWEPAGFTDGILRAWDDEDNVSVYLPVESPFVPGLRRLVLAPAARVEVVVRNARKQPIMDRRVFLTSELAAGPRLFDETGVDGSFTFVGVFPGAYAVGALHASSTVRTYEKIQVRHGETRIVEIQPEESEQFAAVRGRVVDGQGAPVADATLIVTPAGGWADSIQTDASGAFVFYAEECESLLVQANLSSEGDVYSPESVRVVYGADDVLFTRVNRAAPRSFEVEVYDRVTGEEVEHFSATIDRGPGTEKWGNSYAPRRAFELRVLPDSRWRIASHGYIARELELQRELDRLADGERLRVGLERGLDHSFFVRDADTLEPVVGVLFRSEAGAQVRSDASGFVRMQAREWSLYHISKPGYEPGDWDPDDYVLWDWGPVLLERIEVEAPR